MNRKTAGLFLVVAVLAAGVWAGWRTGTQPKEQALGAADLPRPDLLKTGRPQRRDFSDSRRWFGTVKSGERVRIISLASGTVVSVAAGDGMAVSKGAPLFTIKGPLLAGRLQLLRDQAVGLRKRVAIAHRLVAIKQEAVSRKFARQEELAAAEEDLARLKAELAAAVLRRQRLQEAVHLSAPIAGVFTNRRVAKGQTVQKGDPLAEIVAVKHLYVAATLFPGKKAELVGRPAVIHCADGAPLAAAVTRVLPERTGEGATVVWLQGPGLDQHLRPGEKVTGTIVLSVHQQALAVPASAVLRDDRERPYLFVRDSSGYRKKPVKTGLAAGGLVEILSGLREEDQVVVQGGYELWYRDFHKIFTVAD